MKVLWFVLIGVGLVALSLGGFLAYATLRDYNPPPRLDLTIEGSATESAPDEISIFTWNIGYAGLGRERDFFMDGGKESKPPRNAFERYLDGILETVERYSKAFDVFFFQEVDRKADRSYGVDEYERLKEVLDGFQSVFATNYLVDFVPVPIGDPMGRVHSGMAVFSRYSIERAERISLPGQYPWPERIFQLDRCMIVVRLKAKNGRDWVLINTHNSAYDEGGTLRKVQLDFIKNYITTEYEKGNYVVVGGDWNAIIASGDFEFTESTPSFYMPLPEDWTPKGWKWAVDPSVPTNRSVSAPYEEGKNFVTVIDGFLVSPNVEIVWVRGIDLGFEYSDHNPVSVVLRGL